jgi:hypothetical protein
LPAISASKKARAWRGWANTMVRETSTWAIDSSHQYPARRSAAFSGSGSRDSQRWKNTLMVPACSASQIRCSTAGSSAEANPVDSSVKENPVLRACCLARSCPLTHYAAARIMRSSLGLPGSGRAEAVPGLPVSSA